MALTRPPPSASIPPSLSRRSAMYIRATKTHTKGGKIAKSFRLSRSVADRRQGPPGDPAEPGRGLFGSEGAREVAVVTGCCWRADGRCCRCLRRSRRRPRTLVRRLRAVGLGPQEPERRGRERAVATVDLDTLEHDDTRSVGGERVCLAGLQRNWAFGTCSTSCGAGMRGSRRRWWWRRCCIRTASGSRCGGCRRTARRWSLWILDRRQPRCPCRSPTGRGMCCGGCGGRCRRGCSVGSGNCWNSRTRRFLRSDEHLVYGAFGQELLRFGRSKEGRKARW